MFVCCLCQAAGEARAGQIRDGDHVPLCARHRAAIRWRRPEGQLAALSVAHQIACEHMMMHGTATETNANTVARLNQSLGNIDAVRAATKPGIFGLRT